MAGLLKVAAFFGLCTALIAVLIAWYLKENFDPESVRGKKVVICGASTGIGEELAYEYAKLGAQLLLVARREEALQKVVARCGELGAETANYFVADLSSLEAAKRLAAVSILLAIVRPVLWEVFPAVSNSTGNWTSCLTIQGVNLSITKFSIVIGSPRAYLSHNWRAITWVPNYRCPI